MMIVSNIFIYEILEKTCSCYDIAYIIIEQSKLKSDSNKHNAFPPMIYLQREDRSYIIINDCITGNIAVIHTTYTRPVRIKIVGELRDREENVSSFKTDIFESSGFSFKSFGLGFLKFGKFSKKILSIIESYEKEVLVL